MLCLDRILIKQLKIIWVCGRQANEVGFTLSLVVFTGKRRTQHVLLDVSFSMKVACEDFQLILAAVSHTGL